MKFNKKKRDEELRGLHVVVHNGDFTKALRKFKKKVADTLIPVLIIGASSGIGKEILKLYMDLMR